MNIDIIQGYCAYHVGKYWIAGLEGNIWLPRRFRTPEAALKYAEALDREYGGLRSSQRQERLRQASAAAWQR